MRQRHQRVDRVSLICAVAADEETRPPRRGEEQQPEDALAVDGLVARANRDPGVIPARDADEARGCPGVE